MIFRSMAEVKAHYYPEQCEAEQVLRQERPEFYDYLYRIEQAEIERVRKRLKETDHD